MHEFLFHIFGLLVTLASIVVIVSGEPQTADPGLVGDESTTVTGSGYICCVGLCSGTSCAHSRCTQPEDAGEICGSDESVCGTAWVCMVGSGDNVLSGSTSSCEVRLCPCTTDDRCIRGATRTTVVG